MIINVTQEHINIGKPLSPHYCPVSYALSEQVGGKWYIGNVWADLTDGKGGCCKSIRLPQSCRTFIDYFDNHCTVEPFSFEVDLDI